MTASRRFARDIVSRIVEAYNAKDAEALIELYQPDARYWSALDDWQEGRATIRSHIEDLHRRLPETSISAQTSNGGAVGVDGARVSTDSWRVAAEQHVSVVGLTAGVGQDRYRSRATIAASSGVLPANLPAFTFTAPIDQHLTRTNLYAGASLRAGGVGQLTAEVGRVSGGAGVPTYNSFSAHTPTDTYTYVSLGLRVGR